MIYVCEVCGTDISFSLLKKSPGSKRVAPLIVAVASGIRPKLSMRLNPILKIERGG
jgi:hypothetical protein